MVASSRIPVQTWMAAVGTAAAATHSPRTKRNISRLPAKASRMLVVGPLGTDVILLACSFRMHAACSQILYRMLKFLFTVSARMAITALRL